MTSKPLCFVADVHIGNHKAYGDRVVGGLNYRATLAVECLERAVKRTAELDGILVIAGDLFDNTVPPPQLIRKVQSVIEPVPTIILVGNHDQVSTSKYDHAIAPLEPVSTIVDTPRVIRLGGYSLWAIPFIPGDAKEWLPGVLAEMHKGANDDGLVRVGALHLGISDANTPSFLKNAHDSIPAPMLLDLMNQYNIRQFYTGNWHHAQAWSDASTGAAIQQVGALCPTGYDNPGLGGYGGYAVWSGSNNWEEIPGPRFLKLKSPEELDELVSSVNKSINMFVHLEVESVDVQEAHLLLGDLVQQKIVTAGKVVSNRKEKIAKLNTATTEASSEDSIGSSLSAFVSNMPLQPDIDRNEVMRLAKEFLGGAC